MIVHVRFLAVLGLFLLLRVVMAVHKKVVIMVVRVPVRAVLPLVQRIARVVMRHVIVVVRMARLRMRVLGLMALAVRPLNRRAPSLHC